MNHPNVYKNNHKRFPAIITTLRVPLFLIVTICSLWRTSADPPRPDSLEQRDSLATHQLETEILLLRRKEINTEARIERLKIDIVAIDKKWQEARESDTDRRLLIDSTTSSQLTTKVLWEQLTAYRADLENAQLLLDLYIRQRTMLRAISSTYTHPANSVSNWQSVVDSSIILQTLCAAESRWRTERLAESRFEHTALQQVLDSSSFNATDRRLLRKRATYLENKITSDSLMAVYFALFDSTFKKYEHDARNVLVRLNPRQNKQLFVKRIKSIWNFTLYTVDNKPLTIGKILLALMIIVAGLKIAQSISKLIAGAIKHRSKLDEGVVDAGQKLFFYTFAALFTLYALYIVQVPLTAFTVIGGALALGLGFGSQNILKNFISGIILLLERPMKTGDFLEIDGAIGTVESIGLRSTRIRTPDNVHMVLPNSSFLEKNVVNWTLADRLVRLELQVGIQYGSPVYEAKGLLLEAAKTVPAVLKRPEPEVLFSDFGDNALVFHLYFWIRLASIIDRRRVLSAVRFAINDQFTAAGIVIAYPQRDIHLDTRSPLRVQFSNANPDVSNESITSKHEKDITL